MGLKDFIGKVVSVGKDIIGKVKEGFGRAKDIVGKITNAPIVGDIAKEAWKYVPYHDQISSAWNGADKIINGADDALNMVDRAINSNKRNADNNSFLTQHEALINKRYRRS